MKIFVYGTLLYSDSDLNNLLETYADNMFPAKVKGKMYTDSNMIVELAFPFVVLENVDENDVIHGVVS